MEEQRTEISSLGEFGLIKHLTKELPLLNSESKLGIGDDAAVIDPKGKQVVVSTDLLTEGVHFDLMYTPLVHLGYKSIVVNLSDIYAMNARPTQVTVSIAVSNRFSVEALDELYRGIRKACEIYKVDLVGGDTTSSTGGLTISVTALGLASAEQIVKRSTAKKGDLIVVSGDLGGAYLGLQVLEREKEVYKSAPQAQPELEGFNYILERQLKPEARKDIISHLAEIKVMPTSMIDISDGLASEALHLATESGLSAKIYEDKIPLDQQTFDVAREFNLDPTMCALSGGEDYELLMTITQDDYEKLKGDPHFTVIGYMAEKDEGHSVILKDGTNTPLQAQGWNSFNEE
ncbi:thiamine-phosphate kinase [Sanyastnella coralliicola]|uniref:thiamine-phosphate kinase n=1 Tax=Sanyastnella coralliicola TaxID=3069118 RepID=UPI0027B9D1C6|nr:thiamine-phosphate kinase [Longitalea sp. SCSIO 12813]